MIYAEKKQNFTQTADYFDILCVDELILSTDYRSEVQRDEKMSFKLSYC